MAAIENDHLVVNVVYAGPPLAGKTQSVRSLMPLLEGQGAELKVLSPGDWRGRTAFFDWAVYEGGAYEGKSIQCRIMSTPGQVALSARREMLLRAADAVIFVVDSQSEALERAVHCYEEMAPWLAEASRDVPVRVVLQCNKQDLPGTLSPEELNRRLGVPCGRDVYPTSATTGKGLRAAFVAGVRNAVDRARALVARGLVLEAPTITSGEALFDRMQREAAPAEAAPAPSTPAPASARPTSARGAARNKAEGPRPGSGRSSSKAPPPGSSGSARPGPGKSARAPSSTAFTFDAANAKSASGFYPATSPRSSGGSSASGPNRSSANHPPLPADHPFASSAPTARPRTRRAGSSLRPAAGAAVRSPSSERAAPTKSHADTKARSRPSRLAASEGASTTARAAPAVDVYATLMRLRSGGAQTAPAAADAIAVRSSGDSATPAAAGVLGDSRPGVAARGARTAAEAATSHTLVPSEAPASAASRLVPKADEPSSAPPSSTTASAPASSGRRAAISPPSEARSGGEPNAVNPGSLRREGSPARAAQAARAWRPGQGPRPAIMPASAYRALVPAETEARHALPGAEAAGVAAAEPRSGSHVDAASRSPAAASSTPPASAPAASGSHAPPAPGVDDDPVDSGWPEAGVVLSTPPPAEARLQRSRIDASRPAGLPPSTWPALAERRTLTDERGEAAMAAGRGATGADRHRSAPRDDEHDSRTTARPHDGARRDARGASAPLRLLRGTPNPPGDEARPPPPSLSVLERPTLPPASASREPHEAAAAPTRADLAPAADARATTDAATSAAELRAYIDTQPLAADAAHASDVAAQRAEANDIPTLAPSAPADMLLSTERPTLVASALAQRDTAARPAPAAAQAHFADPTTFGLESSRLIEPTIAAAEESTESFRIPETPPGLHAFVAKARLSTPPPPVPPPGDDVIPSLAPSPGSNGELDGGAQGAEMVPPVEFAGPRMPGHSRAPRAVWRRSVWRTLETHITSDATALEDARGRWIGELAPGWYARTLRSAPDVRSARRAFAEEVLRERRLAQYLSRPRCAALTEEADRFWIWQAACRVPTLAAVLGRRLAARESPHAMAEALLDASLAFVEARQRFLEARVPLPLSLHALSVQDDKLVYSGLLPDPGAAFVHPPSDGHAAFEDALKKKWPSVPVDGAAVFAELSGKAAGRLPEPILEIIRSVVVQTSLEASTSGIAG